MVEQGRAHQRKLVLGAAAGGRTEVREGLDEHAVVVTAPNDRLREDRKVDASPAPDLGSGAGSAAPAAQH